MRPGFQMEDTAGGQYYEESGQYPEEGGPYPEDAGQYYDEWAEEAPWQRPRRPVVIGANWRRRSKRTYDYIHRLREAYYEPMTDFLDRRNGGFHAIARPPPARSFDERVLLTRHGPRARASPPPRPPLVPEYQRNTFSDDLLEALGVPLPDPARLPDVTELKKELKEENSAIRGSLRLQKHNNYVSTTSDKILEAMGVRPRGFSELPEELEPSLDHMMVKTDPAGRTAVDEEQ